jgi:EAL domain-containing protein (putative c-di-GMP-specific phosphodiesterase class I)
MTRELVTPIRAVDVDVTAVLGGLTVHLQPIVDLATGVTFAMEALARFRHAPGRPVEEIFASAHEAGFGYLLEAASLRAALGRRSELPDGVRLAVNVSPDVLLHPVVARGWATDLDGVIVEVTEHRASSPAALQDELARLRGRGAAIAVDDVGTGYAGLLRLATMRPDFVKLDRSVVTGVQTNDAQAAVLEALVHFSHRMRSTVIGEGVESVEDIAALVEFDIDYGQGWAIGGVTPDVQDIDPEIVRACQRARGRMLQQRAGRNSGAVTADAMHSVASALSNAVTIADLHVATAQAAEQLGVDLISVSIIDAKGVLREITSSGAIDTACYAVSDYPATQSVLRTGNTVEVHLSDPQADRAEQALLQELGQASLLMLPLQVGDQPIGVLEFSQHTHRRWSANDIANGHGLATHIGHALARITD